MIIREIQIKYRRTSGRVEGNHLTNAEKVVSYLADVWGERPMQEQVWIIPVSIKLKPLGRYLVHLGGLDSSILDPKTVFSIVLKCDAAGFILAHNHPSGDPEPSAADQRITQTLKDGANILSLLFFDHVIVGDGNYFSFKESGRLSGWL